MEAYYAVKATLSFLASGGDSSSSRMSSRVKESLRVSDSKRDGTQSSGENDLAENLCNWRGPGEVPRHCWCPGLLHVRRKGEMNE